MGVKTEQGAVSERASAWSCLNEGWGEGRGWRRAGCVETLRGVCRAPGGESDPLAEVFTVR